MYYYTWMCQEGVHVLIPWGEDNESFLFGILHVFLYVFILLAGSDLYHFAVRNLQSLHFPEFISHSIELFSLKRSGKPWIHRQLVRRVGALGTPELAGSIRSEGILLEECVLNVCNLAQLWVFGSRSYFITILHN